ncbi:MAG: hypothetical protein M1823_006354 [Watsoniomyces obsoletus]|nr:MAG: hypothetical protein M1823_006354 [Watsoniomyces obsoletus]
MATFPPRPCDRRNRWQKCQRCNLSHERCVAIPAAFLAELGRLQTDQDALAAAPDETRAALRPMFRYRVLEFCAAVDAYFRRTRAGASAPGVALRLRGQQVVATRALVDIQRFVSHQAAIVWQPVAGSPEDADLGDVPADAAGAAPAVPGGGGLGGGAAGGAPGP